VRWPVHTRLVLISNFVWYLFYYVVMNVNVKRTAIFDFHFAPKLRYSCTLTPVTRRAECRVCGINLNKSLHEPLRTAVQLYSSVDGVPDTIRCTSGHTQQQSAHSCVMVPYRYRCPDTRHCRKQFTYSLHGPSIPPCLRFGGRMHAPCRGHNIHTRSRGMKSMLTRGLRLTQKSNLPCNHDQGRDRDRASTPAQLPPRHSPRPTTIAMITCARLHTQAALHPNMQTKESVGCSQVVHLHRKYSHLKVHRSWKASRPK
jgi:hypothetical protein